jgi:integrase
MIVVAYKHGMRASEVCNLRVDDLDLKNGSIAIERPKGSLRTTQAVTEHRGELLLNEHRVLREWISCIVPQCDGVEYGELSSWEALWDKYFTGAPARQRQCVEQYKIVKRA